jgi:putative hydrolase of the HAD superfamily
VGGRPTIVFDGDDTLWETQELYEVSKRRFYDLLAELGIDRSASAATLGEIDVANVALLGFSPERFPRSMGEAYDRLTNAHGLSVDSDLREQVVAIGLYVFESAPELRPDAITVLDSLRYRYRLILFSAGDERVQARRIEQTKTAGLFDAIRITPAKNELSWADLVSDFNLDPTASWSIGNSVKSDINPALALGIRCVVVSGASWEYERASVSTSLHMTPPFHAETLTEAAAIIGRQAR